MFIAQSALDLIGRTPMLELKKIITGVNARVLAKMDNMNPTSIKDRAVLSMIKAAIKEGKINNDTEVVEASSGNTAIAIASLGAIIGYKTRIYMSALCSVERHQILCAYGAKVIITPGEEHTKGARERAMAYCEANPDKTFFTNQHANPNNAATHELTTGPEIWEQTKGNIDAVIMGLGTSGTFEGLSRFLKSKNKNIKIIGFEPAASPVYSGGEKGHHNIIGIGPGFVTDNFKRAQKNMDEIILVSDETAFEWTKRIAKTEGILVGTSSGAGAYAANVLASRPEYEGKTIVCIFCDTGERYLSTKGLFPADNVEFVQ